MKLSKISIIYRATGRLFGILVILLVFGGASVSGGLEAVIGFVLLATTVFTAVTVYEYLYWRNYRYEIDSEGMEIVSGVFSTNTRDIPLRRIQNIDVERNIFQRVLGIAEVKIETAGGNQTEAHLRFVDHGKARDIQRQVGELKNRVSEQEGEGKDEKEDFQLSMKNLGVLSLTSLDSKVAGIYFAGLVLAVTSIGLGGIRQSLGPATGIGLLAMGSLAVLWLGSAVKKFEEFFDFKLHFRENALEYEKGLFHRSEGTIPEEKIQTLMIEENFLKRLLGYATLKIETAGYGPEKQDLQQSEAVIPLSERENVLEFAEKLGGYSTPELEPIEKRAKKRYFRRYVLLAGVLAAGIYTVNSFHPVGRAVYILPLTVLLAARPGSRLKWRNIGYRVSEKNVFVQKGFWSRKTYTVPYFRVQNLMRSQTVFQRRWRQNSVTVDTAGSVRTNPEIPDMEHEKAEKVTARIFSKFKNSF